MKLLEIVHEDERCLVNLETELPSLETREDSAFLSLYGNRHIFFMFRSNAQALAVYEAIRDLIAENRQHEKMKGFGQRARSVGSGFEFSCCYWSLNTADFKGEA